MRCGMYYKRCAATSLSSLNNLECTYSRICVFFLFLTSPSFCALHRKRIKYITVIFTKKNCIHSVYNSSDVVWCECFAYNSLSLGTRSGRSNRATMLQKRWEWAVLRSSWVNPLFVAGEIVYPSRRCDNTYSMLIVPFREISLAR